MTIGGIIDVQNQLIDLIKNNSESFLTLMSNSNIIALLNDPTSDMCIELLMAAINTCNEPAFDSLTALSNTQNRIKGNQSVYLAAENKFIERRITQLNSPQVSSTTAASIYEKVNVLYGCRYGLNSTPHFDPTLLLSKTAKKNSVGGINNGQSRPGYKKKATLS